MSHGYPLAEEFEWIKSKLFFPSDAIGLKYLNFLVNSLFYFSLTVQSISCLAAY